MLKLIKKRGSERNDPVIMVQNLELEVEIMDKDYVDMITSGTNQNYILFMFSHLEIRSERVDISILVIN